MNFRKFILQQSYKRTQLFGLTTKSCCGKCAVLYGTKTAGQTGDLFQDHDKIEECFHNDDYGTGTDLRGQTLTVYFCREKMKKMSSAHEDKVADLQNKIRSLQVLLAKSPQLHLFHLKHRMNSEYHTIFEGIKSSVAYLHPGLYIYKIR